MSWEEDILLIVLATLLLLVVSIYFFRESKPIQQYTNDDYDFELGEEKCSNDDDDREKCSCSRCAVTRTE